MTSAFTALDAMLSGAVDARLGQLLRFLPKQRKDNWGNLVSADGRAAADCIGTFEEGEVDLGFLDGDRANSNFNGRSSAQRYAASVERTRFLPGQEPRKGDKLQTIDQIPIRTFEIIDVVQDGYQRLAFALVPATPV